MPIPLIVAAIGIGLDAYGRWKAGSAEKKAGEAQRRVAEEQAKLADFNAAVADLQAQDAITRGLDEESRYRLSVKALVSSQRVGYAAGNLDVNYGSAVDVQADAAYLGELDALTIRTNAAREAWGFRVEGEDLRKRADIARKEGVMLEAAGRQRQTAARIGAVSSIVGGSAQLLQAKYGSGKAG